MESHGRRKAKASLPAASSPGAGQRRGLLGPRPCSPAQPPACPEPWRGGSWWLCPRPAAGFCSEGTRRTQSELVSNLTHTPPWGLTSILSPCWKGKSAFLSSSPHTPSCFELQTMVLTSPWQSKRGLKCSRRLPLSLPTFTANLGTRGRCVKGQPAQQQQEPGGSSGLPRTPHSPSGIRQDLPFDLDALPRLDVQLGDHQSLQGQATAVSLAQGEPALPSGQR